MCLSQQLQSISQAFKPRKLCMSPFPFHPHLLKGRVCIIFISFLCHWHLFLLHPLFQVKGLQISLTHISKEVHFHLLLFLDSNPPFQHSAISFHSFIRRKYIQRQFSTTSVSSGRAYRGTGKSCRPRMEVYL